MVASLALIVGHGWWQPPQLDLSTQGVDDPQHVLQSQGGFACFKLDNEANAHPCRQCQLRLCQPELFASGP